MYVIFIYGKLQSVVGEPLCVSILLLLHFVRRLSWCCPCLLLWSTLSISIFDISSISCAHRGCVLPSVQPLDICRVNLLMCDGAQAFFIAFSVQPSTEQTGDRTLLQEFTCNNVYIYILAAASALSIYGRFVGSCHRRRQSHIHFCSSDQIGEDALWAKANNRQRKQKPRPERHPRNFKMFVGNLCVHTDDHRSYL